MEHQAAAVAVDADVEQSSQDGAAELRKRTVSQATPNHGYEKTQEVMGSYESFVGVIGKD